MYYNPTCCSHEESLLSFHSAEFSDAFTPQEDTDPDHPHIANNLKYCACE